MRRLTAPTNHPHVDCRYTEAVDADGSEPHEECEAIDILVMHAGRLCRPWIRVRVDPATGVVLEADTIVFS